MAKRSYEESARQRLLSAWSGEPEFGSPIGCVATTFTFEPAFFEEHCLARFLRIESDPGEDGRSYLVEREERLSDAFACVLVDRCHVPQARSLRWHVLDMRVPRGGIFHAKVTLLLWQKRVRVLLGSANLTEAGYRRNFEHMSILDFGPDGDLPLALLRDLVAFFRDVRAFSPGASITDGPQEKLNGFLSQVEDRIASWPPGQWERGSTTCSLLPVMPGKPDLFTKLAEAWSGPPADVATVMSPFFAPGEDVQRVVAGLGRLLLQRGERQIEFVGRGWKLADGTVVLDMPDTLAQPVAPVQHFFGYLPPVTENDGRPEPRPLHAKSLWIQRSPRAVFLVGSSNFTVAGTGVGPTANVEANLAYAISDLGDRFAKTCLAAYPPYQSVNLAKENVEFRQEPLTASSDPTPFVPLPDAFGLALLRTGESGLALDLQIARDAPAGFAVIAGEVELIDEAVWMHRGQPASASILWSETRPPSCLEVRWRHEQAEYVALWPVNVGDAEALPPPEELRALSLEDLLEVLTSARPAHEVLAQIWRRRASKETVADGSVVVDPHKRVDTRNFVLQRMKRIAAALEGMRERLSRPMFTVEALRWRLFGPLGPIALAKRLADEEGDGASFMIAEVAMAVHDASMDAPGDLGAIQVPREKRAVVDHLARLAAERGAPLNLKNYVERTFAELTS